MFNITKITTSSVYYSTAFIWTASGRGVLIPYSRSFFTRIPHPGCLVDSLLPLERLFGSWRFPEFLTDRPKISPIPCPNFGESCWVAAAKSRVPSRYFAFSRIPHGILVKSRIPRIPFQTLGEWLTCTLGFLTKTDKGKVWLSKSGVVHLETYAHVLMCIFVSTAKNGSGRFADIYRYVTYFNCNSHGANVARINSIQTTFLT